MNIDMIINITTYVVVILGSLMVIALAAGTTALVGYWALEHIVDNVWGVRNVCEYLIDKRKHEQAQKKADDAVKNEEETIRVSGRM